MSANSKLSKNEFFTEFSLIVLPYHCWISSRFTHKIHPIGGCDRLQWAVTPLQISIH